MFQTDAPLSPLRCQKVRWKILLFERKLQKLAPTNVWAGIFFNKFLVKLLNMSVQKPGQFLLKCYFKGQAEILVSQDRSLYHIPQAHTLVLLREGLMSQRCLLNMLIYGRNVERGLKKAKTVKLCCRAQLSPACSEVTPCPWPPPTLG